MTLLDRDINSFSITKTEKNLELKNLEQKRHNSALSGKLYFSIFLVTDKRIMPKTPNAVTALLYEYSE